MFAASIRLDLDSWQTVVVGRYTANKVYWRELPRFASYRLVVHFSLTALKTPCSTECMNIKKGIVLQTIFRLSCSVIRKVSS